MACYDGHSEGISSAHDGPHELIAPITGLNYQCLQLLARQAAASSGRTFALGQVFQWWRTLDEAARRRAADYPFLLVDAGFADPQRWQQLDDPCVNEQQPAYDAFFTVPEVVAITRSVFVLASSMVLRHRTYARLALGMHPQCSRIIAAHSILDVHQMAEHWWTWLAPRWPQRPEIWRELLSAGAEGGEAHRRARMHGMRLLQADVSAATRRRDKSG